MSSSSSDNAVKLFALVVLALVVGALLRGANPSASLWLDETISAWIAQAPLAGVSERTFAYQGQSPLYFWILSLVVQQFDFSELVLRMPSMVAGAVTLLFVYRLARLWFSPAASWFSTLIMLAQTEFVRALFSARAYMISELFLVVSLYMLARWQRSQRSITLACALLTFVIAFYFHYLIAISVSPVLALFLFFMLGKQKRISFRDILIVILSIALTIPGTLQIISLQQHLAVYSFAPAVSVIAFLKVLIPLEILALCLTTFLLIFFFLPKGACQLEKNSSEPLIFILLLALLPSFTLLLISLVTGESLLIGRYGLASTIGVALIAAWLIDSLQQQRSKWFCIVFLGLLMLINARTWYHEDWRPALQHVKGDAENRSIILLYSGLAESQSAPWLMNQAAREYLTTPAQIYASGVPVLALPRNRESMEFQEYLNKVLEPALAAKDNIYLIALRSNFEVGQKVDSALIANYQPLLEQAGFYRAQGFESKQVLLSSALFSRRQAGE